MEIKLKFTAQLKDVSGVEQSSFTIDGTENFKEVIQNIATHYGGAFYKSLFTNDGNYRYSNLIVLNDYQVNYTDQIQLVEGDQITLMSPISGG